MNATIAEDHQGRRALMLAGTALIVMVGLIHIYDAPDSFPEVFYKGALFAANGIAAAIAAVGIVAGSRWGWHLGVLIAAGAFVGYVISRTVGLPGLPPDEWMEPLGIASLVVEALFVATYFMFVSKMPDAANRSSNPKDQ